MAQNTQQQQPSQPKPAELKSDSGRKLFLSEETPYTIEGMFYTNREGVFKNAAAGTDCSDMTPEDLAVALEKKHVELRLVKVEQ